MTPPSESEHRDARDSADVSYTSLPRNWSALVLTHAARCLTTECGQANAADSSSPSIGRSDTDERAERVLALVVSGKPLEAVAGARELASLLNELETERDALQRIIDKLVDERGELIAERDALLLVAEAVVNGEWEAARELSDAALERHP
jgi:hypothetical protein